MSFKVVLREVHESQSKREKAENRESIEEEEHARGGMEVGAEAHCDVLPETAHMRPAKSKNENQKIFPEEGFIANIE